MSTPVFVDGAAGTTGLEIVARLEAHPEFEPLVLDEARRKDVAARREALNDTPYAVLCLPDDAAREAVALVDPASKTRIVDASSAHRVADGWTYGFPELIDFRRDVRARESIAQADRVANPGCYPTGFLALLQPLIEDGMLPADWPYTVHAVSGYSGGGKALIERFRDDPGLAFRSYGLAGAHKHLPEMQAHACPGGLKHAPVFSPSVAPAYLGMIVEVPLNLAQMRGNASPKGIYDYYKSFDGFYTDGAEVVPDEPVIRVPDPGDYPDELLLRDNVEAWDGIELFVFAPEGQWNDPDATHVRLVARLDNLGKGASGAAIQNLNIMAGFAETASLQLR